MENKMKPYNISWLFSDNIYCESTNVIRYIQLPTSNVTIEIRKFRNPNLRKIQTILNIIVREYIFAMLILITLTGASYLAVIGLTRGGIGYMLGIMLGMIFVTVRIKLVELFERYIYDG